MEDPASSSYRTAAFQWLRQHRDLYGDTLTRKELEVGFFLNGVRIRLVGPKGIFKPAQIRHYPLSIATITKGPYKDELDPDGKHLLYKYRGSDPNHPDNKALRDAMIDKVPLVYFHSAVPGKYLAVWPVFIVHDEPGRLTFTVAADDAAIVGRDQDDADPDIRREYITRLVRQRIHQHIFRDRVLVAYRDQCSVCRLRHESLLDAAHIVPDSDPDGEPVVRNGLALCKLHHAAYDQSYFGIRADYRIEVREDILVEHDGPMLLHGLQEINGGAITVPERRIDRPDPQRLEARYEVFLNAVRGG